MTVYTVKVNSQENYECVEGYDSLRKDLDRYGEAIAIDPTSDQSFLVFEIDGIIHLLRAESCWALDELAREVLQPFTLSKTIPPSSPFHIGLPHKA